MTTPSCPACVLLVEDDERLREAIASFLEERGYATTVSDSLEHAIELLGSVQRPCLVLVDPLTIRFDCTSLFAALGADDRVATLPMVLVSVSAPALLSRPVVVKKPVDFEIVFRIVEEHCCGGDRGGNERARDDALQGAGSG